jgi:hypothetical protein
MKKRKYIVPACIVLDMEEEGMLAVSQEKSDGSIGGDAKSGDPDQDLDAVGGWGNGYNVWDE